MHLLNLLGMGVLAVITVQQTLDVIRNWNLTKLNARLVFRLRQRLRLPQQLPGSLRLIRCALIFRDDQVPPIGPIVREHAEWALRRLG